MKHHQTNMKPRQCFLRQFHFNDFPHSPHPSLGSALPILSQGFATGLLDSEGARVRDTAEYMARRDLFTSGMEMERSELISRREAMRESANRISFNKRVSEGILHVQ